jgi:hypothetical protein
VKDFKNTVGIYSVLKKCEDKMIAWKTRHYFTFSMTVKQTRSTATMLLSSGLQHNIFQKPCGFKVTCTPKMDTSRFPRNNDKHSPNYMESQPRITAHMCTHHTTPKDYGPLKWDTSAHRPDRTKIKWSPAVTTHPTTVLTPGDGYIGRKMLWDWVLRRF